MEITRNRSQAVTRSPRAQAPKRAAPTAAAEPQDTYRKSTLDTELKSFLDLGRAFRNSPASRPRHPQGIDLGENVADMAAVRKSLDDVGRRNKAGSLTGRGVTIGFIDDVNESDGYTTLGDHARRTSELAGGPAPGADQAHFSPVRGGASPEEIAPLFPADMPDDPALLDRYLQGRNGAVDEINTRLQQILGDPDRDRNLRVLNISLGPTRRPYYNQLFARLNQRGEDGSFSNPRLREAVLRGLGPDEIKGLTEDQLRARVAQYVDGRLNDPRSEFQQSMRDYEDTTRQFADNGIALVVAAANSGGDEWDRHSPGSGLNLLARSPHVISVGAANRDKEGNLQPAPLSGRGDPGQDGYRPTVLAPGSHTSFSAPFVSGVIATMLQANPNLSVAQLREMLQQAATPWPDGDPRQQGAGLLDPARALELALQARQVV